MPLKSLIPYLLVVTFVPFSSAVSEISDHGGYSERFKGDGDLEPPRCQLEVPRSATAPFFVKWHCVDNFAQENEIRTELWLYRNDSGAAVLVGNFLGFPAAAYIDETALGVPGKEFTDGLPAGVRLVARDRGGVASITSIIPITAEGSGLSSCDLSIITEGTESSGDTTGVPSAQVSLEDVSAVSAQSSASTYRVSTSAASEADPCEIASICSAENQLSFSSTVVVGDSSDASGTLTITPSETAVEMEGTATVVSSTVTTLSMTGETELDGQTAVVTLSCTR